MSLTTTFTSIVFSRALAKEPHEKQQAALEQLETLFNGFTDRGSLDWTPKEFFSPNRIVPHYGTEAYSIRNASAEDIRQTVEELGFEVRVYDKLGTNGRDYVTIRFSPELAAQSPEQKKEAITQLQDYLESHPEIWTGGDSTISIAEVSGQFLDGRVDLTGTYESEVIWGDLNEGERKDVEALGFSTRPGGSFGFAM